MDLFLLTFNCNKRACNIDGFDSRLAEVLPTEPVSLYAFGLQEFCPILCGCFHDSANKNLLQYNGMFLEILGSKYPFCRNFLTLGLIHVGAIGLIVISPYPLRFKNLGYAKCGFGYGYSSMKGAVGVRLSLVASTTQITILTAHLPAGEGSKCHLERNNSLRTMYRALDFGDGFGFIKPNNHTFLMGDLNYRTSTNHSRESVLFKRLSLLQDITVFTPMLANELADEYDELIQCHSNGDVLVEFKEATIQFAPSYKFHVGTAIYDDKRSPSWCDRIFYQSTYESLPIIKKYESIIGSFILDHQPVYLIISITKAPPKLIILRLGYLQIVGECSVNEDYCGPTEWYIKPVAYSKAIQRLVRPTSDFIIGYGLWLGTTTLGRLVTLVSVIVCGLWLSTRCK